MSSHTSLFCMFGLAEISSGKAANYFISPGSCTLANSNTIWRQKKKLYCYNLVGSYAGRWKYMATVWSGNSTSTYSSQFTFCCNFTAISPPAHYTQQLLNYTHRTLYFLLGSTLYLHNYLALWLPPRALLCYHHICILSLYIYMQLRRLSYIHGTSVHQCSSLVC